MKGSYDKFLCVVTFRRHGCTGVHFWSSMLTLNQALTFNKLSLYIGNNRHAGPVAREEVHVNDTSNTRGGHPECAQWTCSVIWQILGPKYHWHIEVLWEKNLNQKVIHLYRERIFKFHSSSLQKTTVYMSILMWHHCCTKLYLLHGHTCKQKYGWQF